MTIRRWDMYRLSRLFAAETPLLENVGTQHQGYDLDFGATKITKAPQFAIQDFKSKSKY